MGHILLRVRNVLDSRRRGESNQNNERYSPSGLCFEKASSLARRWGFFYYKTLRNNKGWSQAELADKLSLSHGHITRLETGKFNPSTEVLKKLSLLLDV